MPCAAVVNGCGKTADLPLQLTERIVAHIHSDSPIEVGMKRRSIFDWSSLPYAIANTGKGKSRFINFEVARALHYLYELQHAPKGQKANRA